MANKAKKLNKEDLNAVSGGWVSRYNARELHSAADSEELGSVNVTGAAWDSDRQSVTGDPINQKVVGDTNVTEQKSRFTKKNGKNRPR